MELHISCTRDGVKSYPHHSHSYWEIMLYLEGEGYLYTPEKNLPFRAGTILLVPPQTVHGSVSENGFKNISVGGQFKNCFFFPAPICLEDTEDREGTMLATLLFKNRKGDTAYVNSLADAYIHFLFKSIHLKKSINTVINDIITVIGDNSDNPYINLSEILTSYNYTKDYIRQQFKAATHMHPTEFLTNCRIEKACFLMEIYKSTVPLTEIAERCGYLDYVYFSKQFKVCKKVSPREYVHLLQKKSE